MSDCRLVPVLLHHTLASTTDGRTPPCMSPAALIAVTARCCECVPPQEPAATAGPSVVTETGGVTVLPEWGGTKVLPDYMDVRGILNTFAKASALHLRGPPAEWQTGADASAGVGAEVSLVLFPLLEVLELEDCGVSRLLALPSSLRHLAATRHRGASGKAGTVGAVDLGSFLRGAEQLLSLSWTCGELRSSRGAGALRGLQRLDLSRNAIERVEVHACMCMHVHVHGMCMHVHVHVHVHACACMRACMHACMRARVCACMHVYGACTVPTVRCRRGVQGLACCIQLEHLDLGHNRITSAANVHMELAQLRFAWSSFNPKPYLQSNPNPKPEPYL